MRTTTVAPMIFGIGLSRTGTTSLHHALEVLGFRSAPTSVALLDDPNDDVLERYEAFTDNPIPFLYRDLDERYPGSRFVHTTRPLDGWLESMEWLFGEGLRRLDHRTRRLGRRVHRQLYGLRRFDADRLTEIYLDHHRGVDAHFAGRVDLLRLELDREPDPWGKLCRFLDVAEPAVRFPSSNGRDDGPPRRSVRE